jgi:hypothetical protein
MSRSLISSNRRHVNLDIEPVQAPIFGEIGFTAGRDLDSRDPSSGVLTSGVESATGIMSLVELPIVDLYDIRHNNQFKESCESIGIKVTSEGLHDPDKLRNFQERCR